jgi:hypothetical protein
MVVRGLDTPEVRAEVESYLAERNPV